MTSIEVLYQHYLNHPIVSTDTRTIIKGCMFFALRGENFDANTFAAEALQLGAAFVIVDREEFALNENCILVPDVLTALQDLATYHRKKLNIPVIGLTGSNGKTTTKELIKAVLSEKYQVFATKGNLNNHIGVPLSILSISHAVEIAVIEMGANHQKEIAMLCEIAQPTHGLITNIGLAHLDGFGGFEGVKKGKAELYAYLKKAHGYTFIYRNNPYLIEMSSTADLTKVVYYGTAKENSISGELIDTDPLIELKWSYLEHTFNAKANLTGTYNFENILAAICIGNFFAIKPEEINRGLANYFPVNNRSQLTKTTNNSVICDFYNANPSSMMAALNNLKSLSAKHKTVIIGDMFELGDEAAKQHQNIIELALGFNFDELIFIGENFFAFKNQYQGKFFNTRAEAQLYLTQHTLKDSLILLKGSRGMALEQLLPLL
ncbi:UDP-N-acetylmuramoyl-tripeptide--D-alanyl-D-alanine ligase [Pedobacter insulae]|uniref:UDP-N-acetylmuramoyl-tripeptide--D-alanyl-D-alanine ligase n=1 Tax=Pedobacter insulae TaxID=414048 RepID=A0A1I2X960_9SPHI|nr:UDP-N-acetylmuramoyl-tripeptide--D-alanyl-D-alanine ligase [Pedobacter insulae]SFH09226.1 UDP-N-acetylmuramoyl-tripeptide--D-alanyl-D-alanine ligase [Pedobacter insulae]